MWVLILGSLGGELGRAARMAREAGARLDQADTAASALARLRADARVDLLLVELPHDVAALAAALAAERIVVPIVACGADCAPEDAAARNRARAEAAVSAWSSRGRLTQNSSLPSYGRQAETATRWWRATPPWWLACGGRSRWRRPKRRC